MSNRKDKKHEEKYERQKRQIEKLTPVVNQILENLKPQSKLKFSA